MRQSIDATLRVEFKVELMQLDTSRVTKLFRILFKQAVSIRKALRIPHIHVYVMPRD